MKRLRRPGDKENLPMDVFCLFKSENRAVGPSRACLCGRSMISIAAVIRLAMMRCSSITLRASHDTCVGVLSEYFLLIPMRFSVLVVVSVNVSSKNAKSRA
jgi:hypothetical protein